MPYILEDKFMTTLGCEPVGADCEHAKCFLKHFFKTSPDGHYLTNTFHVCSDALICTLKFTEIPTWHFEHHIIKRGFKACRSCLCYSIG